MSGVTGPVRGTLKSLPPDGGAVVVLDEVLVFQGRTVHGLLLRNQTTGGSTMESLLAGDADFAAVRVFDAADPSVSIAQGIVRVEAEGVADPWMEFVTPGPDDADSEVPLAAYVRQSGLAARVTLASSVGYVAFTLLWVVLVVRAMTGAEEWSGRTAVVVGIAVGLLLVPIPVLMYVAGHVARSHGGKAEYSSSARSMFNGEAVRAAAIRLGWSPAIRWIPRVATVVLVAVWAAWMVLSLV